MPRKANSADTISVGKKDGGGHFTLAQVAARQAAAETLKRKEPLQLQPPAWLSPAARAMWEKKIRDTQGVELLDVLDEESLAAYCDAVVQYEKLSKRKRQTIDSIKAMQAWTRIIANYADRLGFTPAARARLVKKRADEKLDEFGKEFD